MNRLKLNEPARRNLKKALLLIVFCLLAASLSSAEVFKIKQLLPKTRRITAYDKKEGKFLWQSEIKSEIIADGKMLYLLENGTGIYGKDRKYKTWHSDAYYHLEKERLIPYQAKLVYKDQAGKTVETMERYYYPKEKKVVGKVDDKVKEFEDKEDLIDEDLLGVALLNYPFEERRDFVFHLLTNEPVIYKMTIKFLGNETLNVGGKSVDCYKLQMIPDLGALNIFGAFVPKTYFWYKTSFPHDFVRYEGLESGLNTPYIVMEADKVWP